MPENYVTEDDLWLYDDKYPTFEEYLDENYYGSVPAGCYTGNITRDDTFDAFLAYLDRNGIKYDFTNPITESFNF